MATSRFDPDENRPYGKCQTCGVELKTEADGAAHMKATFSRDRSHRISITNPNRADRIESEIEHEIEAALDDFVDKIQHLVDGNDVTAAEILEALNGHDEFRDAWKTWLAE